TRGWEHGRERACEPPSFAPYLGRGHRRAHPISALRCDVLGAALPLARCAPLPLVGRGWGWGSVLADASHAITMTPSPALPQHKRVHARLRPAMGGGSTPSLSVATALSIQHRAGRAALGLAERRRQRRGEALLLLRPQAAGDRQPAPARDQEQP